MKLFACIADSLYQIRLHKAVNVLVFIGDRQRSCLDISQYAFQSFGDLIALIFCQNPLSGKHFHMRHAALHILAEKLLVK